MKKQREENIPHCLTAAFWNQNFPIGTPVLVVNQTGRHLYTKTRSRAHKTLAGRPIIQVDGLAKSIDLALVMPMEV